MAGGGGVSSSEVPVTKELVYYGAADYYRDLARHGGILCTFLGTWFNRTLIERLGLRR